MDEKLKQVIEKINELKNEALDEKAKKELEGDMPNYYMYMGKDMGFCELLIEIEEIIS